MFKDEFIRKMNGFLFDVLKASKPTPAQRLEKVKYLVGHGADVNAKLDGKSVLTYAMELKENDLILYLKSQGAKNENLDKKLMEVIRDRKLSSQVRLKKVKYLVSLGADVNTKVSGKSVLTYAKQLNDADLKDFLEQKGAVENKQNLTKLIGLNVKLFMAVKKEDETLVEKLLQSGADANIRGIEGWTPLMLAAQNGNVRIAELLISECGKVNAKNNDGWTPLMLAVQNGHKKMVNSLLNYNPDLEIKTTDEMKTTALGVAVAKGHIEIVENLLKKGADVNAKDAQNNTAIFTAIEDCDVDMVDVLLNYNPDLMVCDVYGNTPLIKAATSEYYDVKIVEMLLNKGVDVNARSNFGQTALMGAAERGHFEKVKMLVENGADISIKGWHGRTALNLARNYGVGERRKVVEYLEKIRDEKRKAKIDGFVNKIFGGKGR